MKWNVSGLLLLTSFLCTAALAQTKLIDSLKLVITMAKEDTARVNSLNALVSEFRYSNTDTAMLLADQALELAVELNYEMGIADAKRKLCALCASQGKFDQGIQYGKEAVDIYDKLILTATDPEKQDILKKMGSAYMVIGHNWASYGNNAEALKYALLSLKIKEHFGDKKGIGDIKYNIALNYASQKNYPEALKYIKSSLAISEDLGRTTDAAMAINHIGWLYIWQNDYNQALSYCSKALAVAQQEKDEASLAEIYYSLGTIHGKLGNYDTALKYDYAALKGFEDAGIREQIPWIYNNIALVHLYRKNYKGAEEFLGKALSFAREINKMETIQESYANWYLLDSTLGNFQQALQHYKLFVQYRDSIINTDNSKKIVQQQMQFDFDKREDSLRQQHIIAETRLSTQKKQRYFYWVGLAMVSVLSVFVFLNFRNQKKINRLAAEAHVRQKADLELQHTNVVMQERLRISRELHDEVGATLSGIAMYSHLAKEQIKATDKEAIEKSLNIMQQSSGEMVNKLNDIVWLINPEQDSLQKLISRLEEYARDMGAIKNMQVKVTVPEKIIELNLPIESRRNIYLFCKEAIINAVKYSNATTLALTVKETDKILEFSVSDNGKGFDAVMVRRGNGLENMQKRADEIGAKLILQSKLNEGALVSLQCKITQ